MSFWAILGLGTYRVHRIQKYKLYIEEDAYKNGFLGPFKGNTLEINPKTSLNHHTMLCAVKLYKIKLFLIKFKPFCVR
jgi:hypothetical protein